MVRTHEVLQLRSLKKSLQSGTGKLLQRVLYRSLGFDKFNSVYSQLPPCSPEELSRVFLEAMEVQTELDGESIEVLPKDGPLVVVSNHPFGLIEGLALDTLLQSVRRDSTVMAVNWLAQIPEFQEHLILVGPAGKSRRRGTSIKGWRQAIGWLKSGHAMAVFPAGRVGRFQWRKMSACDLEWSAHIASVIRRTKARTVPVYFHGNNSFMFNLVAALMPPLVDFRLVREFNNKRKKNLRATIGRVIEPSEIENFATDEEAVKFLRQETEALA
ncbi:MAG: putative hemolysin [Mariniblastus sp.]|jgi:putative hemolysin